jgi:hypothetical protein
MLKTQAVTLNHHESYGLHQADTHIVLPWLDVEGKGKMTWTVHLGKTRWNEAKKFAFPPEMGIVAQEGHKFGRPLGGNKGHQKCPLSHKAVKGEINRQVLKNRKDLERIPQHRVSPARWPLLKHPPHQSLDEGVVSNVDAVDRAIVMEMVDLWMAMVLHDSPRS